MYYLKKNLLVQYNLPVFEACKLCSITEQNAMIRFTTLLIKK